MKSNKATGVSRAATTGWELRPGGMLVQKRSSDANHNHSPFPSIRVKVKYGKSHHEVSISPQASFGDLKKMIAGPTGMHTEDQKMIFKEKERDSKAFLDLSGVKDGTKIVVIEDEFRRERRHVESRNAVAMDKASKEIAAIRAEVDKLAKQVAAIEIELTGGKKLAEKVVFNMTELLMNQLIKLDGISADGDVRLQRRMQVRRVQKYIDILDVLKIHNFGRRKHLHRQVFTENISKLFENGTEEANEFPTNGSARPDPDQLHSLLIGKLSENSVTAHKCL